jgi:transcriptional regulator with XRE-family HTH domain
MIKDRLIELRSKSRYTRKDVGEAIGVKENTYAAYEEGRAEPNIEKLTALASLYGISLDELIHGSPKPRTPVESAYYALPMEKRKIVDFILNC